MHRSWVYLSKCHYCDQIFKDGVLSSGVAFCYSLYGPGSRIWQGPRWTTRAAIIGGLLFEVSKVRRRNAEGIKVDGECPLIFFQCIKILAIHQWSLGIKCYKIHKKMHLTRMGIWADPSTIAMSCHCKWADKPLPACYFCSAPIFLFSCHSHSFRNLILQNQKNSRSHNMASILTVQS